jgi:hypothetical protein
MTTVILREVRHERQEISFLLKHYILQKDLTDFKNLLGLTVIL